MGFLLAANDPLFVFPRRQDSRYHGFWYTSRGPQVVKEKPKSKNGSADVVRSCNASTSGEISSYWASSRLNPSN